MEQTARAEWRINEIIRNSTSSSVKNSSGAEMGIVADGGFFLIARRAACATGPGGSAKPVSDKHPGFGANKQNINAAGLDEGQVG